MASNPLTQPNPASRATQPKKYILIIGADTTNASDMIRAHRVIRWFLEDYPDRPFGRHHFVGYGDTVTVWHTAQQVTVHFYREETDES